MNDYKGVMAVIIETAKKKGVRLDVSDFSDYEIERLNDDVVFLRGRAYELIDRLFKCDEGTLPAVEVGHGGELLPGCLGHVVDDGRQLEIEPPAGKSFGIKCHSDLANAEGDRRRHYWRPDSRGGSAAFGRPPGSLSFFAAVQIVATPPATGTCVVS